MGYTLVATVTEALKMDDIQKGTQNTVVPLKYEKGVLLEVEDKK